MNRIAVFMLSLLTCIGFVSCTSDCYVPQKARMGIAFFDENTKSQRTMSNVTVKGVGSDSLLYANAWVSAVYLPLKATEDRTEFEFSYSETDGTAISATLVVWHEPVPQLISEECGCVVFHTLDSLRFEGAPAGWNIEIGNPQVINVENATNVQVYISY